MTAMRNSCCSLNRSERTSSSVSSVERRSSVSSMAMSLRMKPGRDDRADRRVQEDESLLDAIRRIEGSDMLAGIAFVVICVGLFFIVWGFA
jgi:hypothetical protein